jgi:hypothetical protein
LTATALADAETVGLRLTARVMQVGSDGTPQELGRAALTVQAGTYRAISTIGDVFSAAGVAPIPGVTYEVEVDQNTATQIGGPLGTVTIALTS